MKVLLSLFVLSIVVSCGNPPKKLPPKNLCGNGQIDQNELCDPSIATGDGVCPTAATCLDQGCGSVYSGNPATCDALCEPPTCGADDECCPSGCDSTSDPQCTNTCGNGTVEEGETCDGDCAESCDDRNACTIDKVEGSAQTCNFECSYDVVSMCADDDGCCPDGCDSDSDNDCSANCGNGELDAGETCDGDCPTTCDDANACTSDVLTGTANNCNVVCTSTEIVSCEGGDGCCPAGCSATTDDDCASVCGNQIVEPGETCDSNCPTCDDADACTQDSQAGDPAMCDVVCSNDPITMCVDGDGCCPANCDWTNDDDCPCTPMSCGQQGIACGPATDGCGNNIQCPNCPNGQACDNGTCVAAPQQQIGGTCTQDSQCISGECITESFAAWDGGYCTQFCDTNNPCPNGSFCDGVFGACIDSCVFSCTRPDQECFNLNNEGLGCYPTGSGNGDIGDPCNRWGDCDGGQGGRCFKGNTFYNGYCTEQCDDNNPCPFFSECENGYCYEECNFASDCRGVGYDCVNLDSDDQKVCEASGTGAAQIGDPCAGKWSCASGTAAVCGAPENGFPGGYCTEDCGGFFGGNCPAGSECSDSGFFGSGNCVESCANNADCTRVGYSCQKVGADLVDACWPI